MDSILAELFFAEEHGINDLGKKNPDTICHFPRESAIQQRLSD